MSYIVIKHTSVLTGLTVSSLAAVAPAVTAATVNQVLNGEWGQSNIWSDGLAASAANDYFVGSGFVLDTPNFVLNSTFGGGSLTVETGGTLRVDGQLNHNRTVNNFTLNGGTIAHGSIQSNRRLNVLGNSMNVAANSIIEIVESGGQKNLSIGLGMAITGSADLVLNLGNDPDDLHDIVLFGTGTTFSGLWDVNGGGLFAETAGSLGTGGVDIDLNSVFDVDYDATFGSLVLDGVMTLDQDHTVTSATIAGTSLANGVYTFADLNTLFDANFEDGGTGSITVIPEPAALALIAAGAACTLVRPNRRDHG